MRRFCALASIAFALWGASPPITVAELIAMVRAGLRARQSDGALAKTLHKVHLSERLDYRVLEELESESLGPKALAELSQLREATRELSPPAAALPFEAPPPPTPDDLRRVLDEARTHALAYTKSLPDFICTQAVSRSDNVLGRWHVADRLEIRLSYFGQREDYKLLKINGRAATRSYDAIGGAITEGEFGSLLRQIFEPASRAEFHFDHWTRIRKRPAYVVAFYVTAEHSKFRLEFQRGRGMQRFSIVPGQRGFVWIDRDTKDVLRILAEAADVPEGFPVRSSSSLLDYDYITVGSRPFLLPVRADVRMGSHDLLTRNEVEFKDYRKFSSEATISFEQKQ